MAHAFRRFWKRVDTPLFLLALFFSVLSVTLLLGIASMKNPPVGRRTILVQGVCSGLGLLSAVLLSRLDYESLARLWKFYLPFSVLLMLLTLTPLGQTRRQSLQHNRNWLSLGSVTVQPSEFLKIAFILSLALHLSRVRGRMREPLVVVRLAVHACLPVLLILLQRDLGVAMVMLFIVLIMILLAGLPKKWVLAGAAGLAVLIPLAWKYALDDYQRIRFLLLKNPERYAFNQAYQQLQGRIAFGSGRLFGVGLFGVPHRYVPDMHTDMIFDFFGESFGFVGASAVLLAYFLLLTRILKIGFAAKDPLGRYICVGVFAMLTAQILINIGMCLLIFPSVGVTLPLLSAGGSSVLSVYLGLGLVLSVRAGNRDSMFSRRSS